MKRNVIKNVYRFLRKVSVNLLDFNETWILSTEFEQILKYYFMKIHSVWADLFHVDRQTERPTGIKKLIIALLQFLESA
jgi:hypothetical protein